MPRGVSFATIALVSLLGCGKAPASTSTGSPPNTFRVAFISDTHLIDQYYQGPENTPLDTESIYHSAQRLQATRETINHIYPRVEQVFVSGDIVHDFVSPDPAYYLDHQTVFDTAHALFGGFLMPVNIGLGNHDYSPTFMPRTATEKVFNEKLGMPAAYYAADYKGWQFLMMNCAQGDTYDPESPKYDTGTCSFGQAQLQWMQQKLADDKPTVITFHIPLFLAEHDEVPGLDFFTVLAGHPKNVKMIISGHTHIWFDLGMYSGVPHQIIAATRYDENAIAVADLTTDSQEFNWVHQDLWHVDGHGSDPWPSSELR